MKLLLHHVMGWWKTTLLACGLLFSLVLILLLLIQDYRHPFMGAGISALVMAGITTFFLCLTKILDPIALRRLNRLDDSELERLRHVAYSQANDSFDCIFEKNLFRILVWNTLPEVRKYLALSSKPE